MLILSFLLLVVGLILLIKSADFLVDGASALALRFNISPMVIGLTIVAFGTSAPELVVSVTSALSGNTDIALGNIIGSNIANILLILGISSIIYPLAVHKNTVWKEIPMSFLGAVLMAILGLQSIIDEKKWALASFGNTDVIGTISFSNGLILLCFFVIFLYYTFGISKTTSDEQTQVKQMTPLKATLWIIMGLIGLVAGSSLLVDNAVILAQSIGVSQVFIGLTVVALGTSLPELVTSIVAARKKQVEIAVGNIVGSNIFNIFFILGITSLVKDVPLTGQHLSDIIALFIATLILFVSLFVNRRHCITRIDGIFMLITYAIYLVFLVSRG